MIQHQEGTNSRSFPLQLGGRVFVHVHGVKDFHIFLSKTVLNKIIQTERVTKCVRDAVIVEQHIKTTATLEK